MKKMIGIAVTVVMMSVLLTGCYSTKCEQPAQQAAPMKGAG